MKFWIRIGVCLSTIVWRPGVLAVELSASVLAARDSITKESIHPHMVELADPRFDGRGAGSGDDLDAASYLIGVLRGSGVKAERQKVPLRIAELTSEGTSLSFQISGEEFWGKPKEDCLIYPDYFRTETRLENIDLVYVGYGVDAQDDLGYNDYEREPGSPIDVKGKVVVYFAQTPPTEAFSPEPMAYYSGNDVKGRTAVERGAIGVIVLWTPRFERVAPWSTTVDSPNVLVTWVGPDGKPFEVWPELQLRAALSISAGEKLLGGTERFAEAVREAEAGRAKPQLLDAKVSFAILSKQTTAESENVYAIVPGKSEANGGIPNEYVVWSGHYDHLGRVGNKIFPGALDNAWGVGSMLEAIRAFRLVPEDARPRRPILFLFPTAEEKGLRGSSFFVQNPPKGISISQIVANFNVDMPMIFHELHDVTGFGANYSSLQQVLETAAADCGIEATPDPNPERLLVRRGDQYSFLKGGVPPCSLKVGEKTNDPLVNGAALDKWWRDHIYHTHRDTVDQPFHFSAGEAFARFCFALAYRIADLEERPVLHDGFFKKKFGKK